MRFENPPFHISPESGTSPPARFFDGFGVRRTILRLLMAATGMLALPIPVGGIASGPSVDDLASDFSVATIDGKTFTLPQQKGKILVYFFSFPG